MNYALARDQYRSSRTAGLSELSNPHEMISLTLAELRKSVAYLAREGEKPAEIKSRHISRALTAVYVLQTSLDFDRGGEIANNLFRLYEFCRQQLLREVKADGAGRLVECRDVLEDILDAWQSMT